MQFIVIVRYATGRAPSIGRFYHKANAVSLLCQALRAGSVVSSAVVVPSAAPSL